jgi:hypothetical protein
MPPPILVHNVWVWDANAVVKQELMYKINSGGAYNLAMNGAFLYNQQLEQP